MDSSTSIDEGDMIPKATYREWDKDDNAEKTPKTTEEICRDYITMFKVYNDDAMIVDERNEIVSVDGKEAGRVEIYINDENDEDNEENGKIFPGIISYLISLDDREITVVFTGTDRLFKKYKSEINEIVESIKLK